MPFTFSHPIAILPLASLSKKWFSLTGLIIGSMIPDFEYFIRMRISSQYSHTLAGAFWFNLPLVILVAFIFHNIVKNSLYKNLPQFLQERFIGFTDFNWNKYFKTNWLVVIISALIGIFSHLFWDSFTHENGYFVERFSLLSKEIDIFSYPIPVFKILQHLSSLIGGILLFIILFRLPESKIQAQKINYSYWLVFLLTILIIISIRFFTGLDYKLYGQVIVNLISATIIALIITPLFVKRKDN